jgi:hypothetical protein
VRRLLSWSLRCGVSAIPGPAESTVMLWHVENASPAFSSMRRPFFTRGCSHSLTTQLAGLLYPSGELSFIESVVLVNVEVAHFLVLGLAGGRRT